MDILFEIAVRPAPKGSRVVAATLHRQLKDAILEGRLKAGTRLPSTRDAPKVFGVSRNTVQDVYERLALDCLVGARHGSGTFVAKVPRGPEPRSSNRTSAAQERHLSGFWTRPDVLSWMGYWHEPEDDLAKPVIADLRPALTDPSLFPQATFRQVMARQLRRLEQRPASFRSPQGNQGNHALRHAISDHIGLTRAIACSAQDVVVTSGAQQAFDLIARVLVSPGQTVVAVEDPGYPPMRVPFAAAGAQIVPVRVDGEGLVVDELPDNVDIICVCPSHQFPLGMSLSPSRRAALRDWAKRTGSVIVEDDYDGEFRYDGAPLEALRADDSADRVFYVGSFSKSMYPAIRLGYVVAPRWALVPLTAAKNSIDWHCPVPVQAAVAGFITDGHLAKHVRRVRRVYRERRDRLLDLIAEQLPQLTVVPSFYGMHVAALTPEDVDCDKISRSLARRGILMHSLRRYFLGAPSCDGFVFSYAAAAIDGLTSAMLALKEELNAVDRLAASCQGDGRPGSDMVGSAQRSGPSTPNAVERAD